MGAYLVHTTVLSPVTSNAATQGYPSSMPHFLLLPEYPPLAITISEGFFVRIPHIQCDPPIIAETLLQS